MTTFALKINEILDDKGLKRSDLVNNLKIPEATVRSWFNRESMPSVDFAVKVADFLGVSVEYLVTGKEMNEKSVRREPSALEKKIDRLSAEQKKAVETLIDSFAADKKEE
ncbi:MAG: helix-turn-helix domain-containing protein [Treponema sp.]|nr:helix-turn-helix domain-containing protein [Treponema sp.]